MYPWQRAKERWINAGCGQEAFETLLGRYIAEGAVVYSSQDAFILAMPVRFEADGSVVHDPDWGDTWFVHLAAVAGSAAAASGGGRPSECLRPFLNLAPYQLPWVAWHRWRDGGRRFRRYPWEQLASRLELQTA